MPPPGICGIGASFFGFSAIIASVVIRKPATTRHPEARSHDLHRVNHASGDEVDYPPVWAS